MTAPRLEQSALRGRSIALILLLVAGSVLAVGAVSIRAFGRAIEPELVNRTRLIGSIVRGELQRALEFGIPIDAIAGLDRYLADTLEKFAEVDRIAVVTAGQESLAVVERAGTPNLFQYTRLGEAFRLRQSEFVLPVLHGNRLVGEISVEISPLFVQTRLRDVFLDVMVIALVAVLIALELALAVSIASVGKPMARVLGLLKEQGEGDFRHIVRTGGIGGLAGAAARLNDHAQDLAERLRQLPDTARRHFEGTVQARIADSVPQRLRLSDVTDIRLALFLYSVSTEVAAAFLPLYAAAATRPDWLSPTLAAAAPLALYLLALAAIAPLGGHLVRRFGARRLFLASMPLSVLALLAMGFSETVLAITAWRGVLAVFYATATIACQDYAIRAAPNWASARPVGTFMAVVYGGVFCGSALGGVVAGRFGFEAAFLLGAGIAVLAAVLGAAAMRGRAGDAVAMAVDAAGGSAARAWFNPRFLALLFGTAVPMNAATAIFIWYLTPLTLSASGAGPAEVARVVMLYYLAVVLFGPAVAKLSDEGLGPLPLVLIGAVGSGLALLSLTLWSGYWAIVLAVAGLGLAHTLMRAPLYALALRATGGPGGGLSLLRSIERIGAMLGLMASAWLIADVGAAAAIRGLGIAILCGVAFYAIVEGTVRSRAA